MILVIEKTGAMLLSFLFVQDTRGEGAFDLHCAEWAELLAAEAFNALFTVDYGLAALHGDCLRGAYLLAFFAALAFLCPHLRLCLEAFSCNFAEKL